MVKFSNTVLSYYPKMDKYILGNAILIPVWIRKIVMYDTDMTNINIFQETILKLINAGQYDRQQIASWLGVDVELVDIIIDTQLIPNGWIVGSQRPHLTAKGKNLIDKELNNNVFSCTRFLIEDTIAEKELAVIQANEKLNLEREQLREDIAQFEQKIALHQQKVQWDYQGQIDDLKQYNQHIEKTLEKTNRHNNELKEKLRNFAELQTQLAENDIASISDTLTTLQRENRELKQKLSERQEDGLEELNEELERRVSELEEQIFELTNKNASMSAQLHQQRMSVQARHFLEQEKLALENHKRILTAIVDEQTKKLEGLEAQQSGHLPFKALSQMDSDYRSKPPSLIDVPALSEFVKIIQANIAKQNLYYSLDDIRLFIAGLAMSKLHLLQGISGTGKTSLAQSFARAMNNVYDKEHSKLYCEMVRVQAGWRDKEDLLGYYNEFEKRFNSKETLQALYRAQQPQFEDTLQIILLDEMNLSQPEQYFAEFLSLFETPDTDFINLIDAGNDNAPRYFVDKRAIRVPKNVWLYLVC